MRVLLVPAASIAAATESIVCDLRAAGLVVEVGSFDRSCEEPFEIVAGPGTMGCTALWLDDNPQLRGLVGVGVGCEGFDVAAAAARSIPVLTGATREGVAAMAGATIMLMLACCHDLPGAQRAFEQGVRRDVGRARAIDELTIGVIGYGAIGRDVVRRLRAWNVTVLVASPSLSRGILPDGAQCVPLDILIEQSDLISLHAALTPDTHHLIDRARIARMKRGALLVNTARGALVDEAALAEALTIGALGAAALDCFSVEPLPDDSPLRDAPNLILTPHQIGHTAAGAGAVARTLVENIVRLAHMG
ncbi:NAD(P)-dependent oxidoreductase [Sphingomonas sp. AR_OL41]|uniref:NAD(P)-dependent oxidoreductase n=1 Tax=Sphingomonas sp. AR_OL41 TaxID=3042729 RepID=UPI00248132D1|nr:NAD(P)-dependent oxidoreductase [Sphingomonas sp. AR_OL41]MDH7971917.1 NAD(P)-dependent oxidoreductase [Sphingomonas sp. AR_OL41]